jgi:hypothetical protein
MYREAHSLDNSLTTACSKMRGYLMFGFSVIRKLRITGFFGLCPSSGILKTREHNSTNGASGRHTVVSEIPHLIRCIGIYGLGLFQKKFTSASVLVSGPCMLYHNFYCIFSCYLPSAKPGFRCLYGCNYTDMGCPVLVVSSF